MRQSLRYASWLLLLFILLSCSHRVTGEATALPPILQAEAQSQKYNLQLDFMKHHFSGMLIVRQMPNNEIRILGSTYSVSYTHLDVYKRQYQECQPL